MKALALPWSSAVVALVAAIAMPFAGASLWLAFAVLVAWLASLWLARPEPEIVQVRTEVGSVSRSAMISRRACWYFFIISMAKMWLISM